MIRVLDGLKQRLEEIRTFEVLKEVSHCFSLIL